MVTAKLYFGIDLGTTYSCIACVNANGEAEVIPNCDNQPTTPSAVFFEQDGSAVVGQYALRAADQAPDHLITEVKRCMGVPDSDYTIDGKTFSPQAISAFILKKVILDAEQEFGTEIQDVVITCPAYFGLAQKEATRQAGELAGQALQATRKSGVGITVHHILQEPLAAALHYGVKETPPAEPEDIMVFDLGGGTFDVTLIRWSKAGIEELVTEGDRKLGGKDWDQELITYVKDQFCQQTGCSRDALNNSNEATYELMIRAEEAKKDLTARNRSRVSLVHETHKGAIEITREIFDSITADLLEQTIVCTRRTLATAEELGKIAKGALPSRILLVGGSTRMPQVRARLEKEFPGLPIQFNEPDEAVAKGAAKFAQILQLQKILVDFVRPGAPADAPLTPAELLKATNLVAEKTGIQVSSAEMTMISRVHVVTAASHSFGIEALNDDGKSRIFHLIKKGATLPADVTDTFHTSQANQRAVASPIFETDSLEKDVAPDYTGGTQIGKVLLEGLPPDLRKNSEIDVTFVLNSQGILEVTARERTSGLNVSVSIQTGTSLSTQELAKEAAKIVETPLQK